jgi:two-component system, NarL family, sensor histidine kinase UhpB
MNNKIRVLFVEDSPTNMELAECELQKRGIIFVSERIETENGLYSALNKFFPDVVICDYSMPAFDGMKALNIILKHDRDIPVIILTGSAREHIAVECMKAGAKDYVIKEHITRLPFAVLDALEKRKIKIEADNAINELLSSRNRLLSLFEYSPVSIREEDYSQVKIYLERLSSEGIKNFRQYFDTHPDEVVYGLSLIKIIDINQTGIDAFGAKSKEDFIENYANYIKCESINTIKNILIELAEGKKFYESNFQLQTVHSGNKDFYFTLLVVPGYEETLSRIIVNFFDVTESKKEKQALDKNLDLIEKILASSPNLIYIYDLTKKVFTYSNNEIISTLGYTAELFELSGSSLFSTILHPDDVENVSKHQENYLNMTFGKVYELDYRVKHSEGQWIWLHSRDVLFSKDKKGKVTQILGTVTDITKIKIYEENLLKMSIVEQERNIALNKSNKELITICEIAVRTIVELQNEIENRKEIELKIRQTQTLLETVLESLNDMILVAIDKDYRQICYNKAHVDSIKSYNSTVTSGKSLLDCITIESDRINAKKNYDLCFTGKSYVTIECLGPNRDYFEIRFSPIFDDKKEVIGATSVLVNINKRINAENELHEKNIQLQKLNKHIVNIRENERLMISREIHDQLGQSLTALKMDLTCYINNSSLDQENKCKLDGMIDLVTDTISDVQRISSELRPGVLDDLGLAPAIEWYCDEFERRTGLQLKLHLNNVQSDNINDNLTVYRVLQESLTNVIRHSQAKSVTIRLKEIKKCISLTVKDDGIGITKEKIKSAGSLGLRGMYERVKQSGGSIRIMSPGNSGTKIQVYIPINSSCQ